MGGGGVFLGGVNSQSAKRHWSQSYNIHGIFGILTKPIYIVSEYPAPIVPVLL